MLALDHQRGPRWSVSSWPGAFFGSLPLSRVDSSSLPLPGGLTASSSSVRPFGMWFLLPAAAGWWRCCQSSVALARPYRLGSVAVGVRLAIAGLVAVVEADLVAGCLARVVPGSIGAFGGRQLVTQPLPRLALGAVGQPLHRLPGPLRFLGPAAFASRPPYPADVLEHPHLPVSPRCSRPRSRHRNRPHGRHHGRPRGRMP